MKVTMGVTQTSFNPIEEITRAHAAFIYNVLMAAQIQGLTFDKELEIDYVDVI